MSIDIKSLRIGAHVEYCDKRVRVEDISTIHLEGSPMRILVWYKCIPMADVSIEDLHPIPITPELLAELGFEYVRGEYLREDMNIANYIDDLWYVNFNHADVQSMGMIRYLHELEAMYYHVFHKELIEE